LFGCKLGAGGWPIGAIAAAVREPSPAVAAVVVEIIAEPTIGAGGAAVLVGSEPAVVTAVGRIVEPVSVPGGAPELVNVEAAVETAVVLIAVPEPEGSGQAEGEHDKEDVAHDGGPGAGGGALAGGCEEPPPCGRSAHSWTSNRVVLGVLEFRIGEPEGLESKTSPVLRCSSVSTGCGAPGMSTSSGMESVSR
jgi:hypothetical protein